MKNRLLLLLLCVASAWIAVRAACDGTGSEANINCGASKIGSEETIWGWNNKTTPPAEVDKLCGPNYLCNINKENQNTPPQCVSCWRQSNQNPTPLAAKQQYDCNASHQFYEGRKRPVKLLNKKVTGEEWQDCLTEARAKNAQYREWNIKDGNKIMCGNCDWEGCGPCTIAN